MSDADLRWPRFTIERISILLGLLALAFTAGSNWHRLDGAEAAIAGLSRQADVMKADYERKDVLEVQLKRIEDKLELIRQETRP